MWAHASKALFVQVKHLPYVCQMRAIVSSLELTGCKFQRLAAESPIGPRSEPSRKTTSLWLERQNLPRGREPSFLNDL
jgi:hypothetical protein